MVTLYVEGGGDAAALKIACREGFHKFLAAAGLGNKPRIVACGTRRNAYERFCLAIEAGDTALLLVDSEVPVAAENQKGPPAQWRPWRHLKSRSGDGWIKPARANERQCHLMVQCMESWLIADPATLSTYFGQGFSPRLLPSGTPSVEMIDKRAIFDGLKKATKSCKTKSPYGKGEHSFAILSRIDPAAVTAASQWACRFIDALERTLR